MNIYCPECGTLKTGLIVVKHQQYVYYICEGCQNTVKFDKDTDISEIVYRMEEE